LTQQKKKYNDYSLTIMRLKLSTSSLIKKGIHINVPRIMDKWKTSEKDVQGSPFVVVSQEPGWPCLSGIKQTQAPGPSPETFASSILSHWLCMLHFKLDKTLYIKLTAPPSKKSHNNCMYCIRTFIKMKTICMLITYGNA
jgi:hypothetical protein